MKSRTLIKALATIVALVVTSSSHALDFGYSFVNNAGSPNTTAGAVVTGKILGLNDNTINFQQVTVTLDAIAPDDNVVTVPFSWFEYGVFEVSGGAIVSAAFSKHDTLDIDLNTAPGGRFLINTPDFGTYYRNSNGQGAPDITFTPLKPEATPDGGASTLGLLGLSMAGVASVRRSLVRSPKP